MEGGNDPYKHGSDPSGRGLAGPPALTFGTETGYEGTFARRAPGEPGIKMNVPAIYHNALPPNPSSSPGTLSTSTLYDCWQSIKFPFFRPANGTIICTLPL